MELVPFGKYKGLPFSKLIADRKYCDWLMMQPKVREQFPGFYNFLERIFGNPTETPEHNRMQARFLGGTSFVEEFIENLGGGPATYHGDVKFEQNGWDVVLSYGQNGNASLTLAIECKPFMGNDYPVVLRQVLRHRGKYDGRCVWVGMYDAVLNECDIVHFFEKSGVMLVIDKCSDRCR